MAAPPVVGPMTPILKVPPAVPALSSVPEVSPPEDSSWASSPPPQAARLRTMTMAIMRAKNFFFIL